MPQSDESKGKWLKLAQQLREAGWTVRKPRDIKAQMHAGRCVFHETDEKNSADRTIYAYAVHWKKPPPEGFVQIWIDPAYQDRVREEGLRDTLAEQMRQRPASA